MSIARSAPYCLFLDELNACSHEVQKAFYSLIHGAADRRILLPEGPVVIGAGNRAHDSAIVKPMSSALIDRRSDPCASEGVSPRLVGVGGRQ